MNDKPNAAAFDRWLASATRSLPSNISAVVRGELEAHYQDALEAHLKDGLPPEKAAAAALADLGDAAEVAADLRTAHLSRRQALAAMLACMVYPLVLMLLPTLYVALGHTVSYLVQDVSSMVVLVFILYTLIRLIGYNNARLAFPARLVAFSIVFEVTDRLASYALTSRLPFFGPGEVMLWRVNNGLALALDYGFVLSELLMAAGVAWLSVRLLRMDDHLSGMQRPAAVLLGLNAPIGLGLVWSIFAGKPLFSELFSVIGYAVVTLLLALMILIFFRAAFRPSGTPLKAA